MNTSTSTSLLPEVTEFLSSQSFPGFVGGKTGEELKAEGIDNTDHQNKTE
jgi:hypothetical protein